MVSYVAAYGQFSMAANIKDVFGGHPQDAGPLLSALGIEAGH